MPTLMGRRTRWLTGIFPRSSISTTITGGGEFYFTARNTLIAPKKGTLLAFTAGFHHEHAVLRVAGNQRLTMPFFFSFDKSRADSRLL